MSARAIGILLAIVGTLLGVSAAGSCGALVVVASQSAPAPAAVGPGFPVTADVTVSTSAVEIGPAQTGGSPPISISVYNPTSNACYWGDSAITTTEGTSYCASGCDRDVPMGGDFRKIWVICASSSGLDAHFMVPQEI
jgi:hypothetical protein